MAKRKRESDDTTTEGMRNDGITTNKEKKVPSSNECNEGIVMQTHVYENDVNILMVANWFRLLLHSELYRENHTNYLQLPERIIAQRNEIAEEY